MDQELGRRWNKEWWRWGYINVVNIVRLRARALVIIIIIPFNVLCKSKIIVRRPGPPGPERSYVNLHKGVAKFILWGVEGPAQIKQRKIAVNVCSNPRTLSFLPYFPCFIFCPRSRYHFLVQSLVSLRKPNVFPILIFVWIKSLRLSLSSFISSCGLALARAITVCL